MCGISGVIKKGAVTGELQGVVERMNDVQSRRGPDDRGIFIDEKSGIALGHRRLSILDLSAAGCQPMEHKSQISNLKSQNLWITFNGEIYNFLELKKDLEKKGHKFKTKTDTEVILALYAEYGEKSFEILRGMFAFGLWDGAKQKLFLIKDRYGIKPLYYYSDENKIVFASTVKALEKSGMFAAEKNPQAMIGFLLFGSVPLPFTTIKNVFAVPSGHYLVREADGEQKIIKYYDFLEPFLRKVGDDLNGAVLKTRKLLKDSVSAHLISDAPLGVFLSGGLDSSAIAALAAKSRENPITTLSIVFDEPEFSEERYSDLVAQKIQSDHRKIKITAQDFYDSFNEIFEAMDQPTIDGVNTFFVSWAAKKAGLKTVLSGLGADEIFLGYKHFHRAEFLRKIQKIFSIFGRRTPYRRPTSIILNLLGGRYAKLNYFTKDDILSFYLGIRGLFSPQETAKILDINLSEVNNFIINMGTSEVQNIDGNFRTLGVKKLEKLHPIDLLSYLELKFYLQNQLLKDTDFMSMYHSIEVRVPFLDHKLIEYVSTLSPELKLNLRASDVLNIDNNFGRFDFQKLNKSLLVAAVSDLLPAEIFGRPKMGFTFPFQKWLKEKDEFKIGHWSRFWAKKVLDKFVK